MNARYHGRTVHIYSLVYICYLFASLYAVYFHWNITQRLYAMLRSL